MSSQQEEDHDHCEYRSNKGCKNKYRGQLSVTVNAFRVLSCNVIKFMKCLMLLNRNLVVLGSTLKSYS
jgi:hypothetical protein